MEGLLIVLIGVFITVGSIRLVLWRTERYMWQLFNPILDALDKE